MALGRNAALRIAAALASGLGATLLSLTGCWHDWDDYEAPAGSTDTAPTVTLCEDLCAAYESCVGAEPDCLALCAAAIADCSAADRAIIAECVDALAECPAPAVAEATLAACLATTDCDPVP